jgi:hypothetical protein
VRSIRLCAAAANDIGPEIDTAGAAVAAKLSPSTLLHAASIAVAG